ncbi:hypothetical protein [Pseudothermotoga elfii]
MDLQALQWLDPLVGVVNATDIIDFILNFEDVIRRGKKVPDIFFFSIVEYMLFSQTLSVQSLSYNLIDSLIYELFFKEKFHQDGLYPEPKNTC